MPSPWIAGFQLWGFRGEKGMRNGAILLCCGGIIFQNGGFSGGQLRLIFRGDLVRMDFSPRNHWSTYIKLSRKWKNNNRPLFCWVIREAEGVMSIFPEFLKSGYLLLLSMKIYLVGCTQRSPHTSLFEKFHPGQTGKDILIFFEGPRPLPTKRILGASLAECVFSSHPKNRLTEKCILWIVRLCIEPIF